MNKNLIKDHLLSIDFVREGDFKLTSGVTTRKYFNLKKVFGHPKIFSEVVDLYQEVLDDEFADANAVGAMGYGGVPVAALLSERLDIPATYFATYHVNDSLKINDTGHKPNSQDAYVFVDDIFTTAGSMHMIQKVLDLRGAALLGSVVFLNQDEYGNDMPENTVAILNASDFD